MKKLIIFVLTWALTMSVSLNCFAAEEALTISDVTAKPGETVYLTVTLNESIAANTIGVTYEYDSNLLQAVPSSCSWARKGLLQDFDKNGSGVWAAKEADDLKGAICILAFQILPDADFSQATVSVTVLLKKDATEVGRYTAEAVVSKTCSHSYGEWSDMGSLGHSRNCTACGASSTEAHSWNEGELTEKENDPSKNLMTYTCTVCGATKSIEVAAQNDRPTPTEPVRTEPPVTVPTMPTMPPETQPPYTIPQETEPTAPQVTEPTAPQVTEPTPPQVIEPTAPQVTEPPRENQGSTGNQVSTGNQGGTGNQGSTSNQGKPNNQGNSGKPDSTTRQESTTPTERPFQDYNNSNSNSNSNSNANSNSGSNQKPDSNTPPTKPTQGENSGNQAEHNIPESKPSDDQSQQNDHEDHNHPDDRAEIPAHTSPMVVPAVPNGNETVETGTEEHDHDHTLEPEETGNPVVNAIMTICFLAVAIGGALYYVKKKR